MVDQEIVVIALEVTGMGVGDCTKAVFDDEFQRIVLWGPCEIGLPYPVSCL